MVEGSNVRWELAIDTVLGSSRKAFVKTFVSWMTSGRFCVWVSALLFYSGLSVTLS